MYRNQVVDLYRGDSKSLKITLDEAVDTSVLAVMTVAPQDGSEPVVLSTENSMITFAEDGKSLTVSFLPETTKLLTWTMARFDVQLTLSPNNVQTVASGWVRLTHDISK